MDTYANDGTPIGSDNNVNSWFQFAQRPYDQGGLGLAPHQAAGVVGNLVNESGSSIAPWGVTGDNGTAFGAAQWRNERFSGLKQFAKDNGLDYRTTEAQQAWMRHELSTTHNGAYAALQSAQTPEQAANIFNRHYEISADTTGNRAAAARALFNGGPAALASKSLGRGALAYANDDDEEDTPTQTAQPALGQGPGSLSKGEWKQLLKGDAPDKMSILGATLAGMGSSLAGISNPQQAYALMGAAKQIADQGKSKYKITVGKDGTLYRIDDEGNVMTAGGGTSTVKYKPFKWRGTDGADHVLLAGSDGSYKPLDMSQGGMAAPPAPTTPEELQAIDPTRAAAAKAVFEGRAHLPMGSRLNPAQQQLRNDVFGVYPGVDENTLVARKRFQESKANSQPTSFGGLMARSEIAADQLDKTLDAYGQIGNTDSALGVNAAKAENYLSSAGTKQGNLRAQLGTAAKNAASDINSVQNGGRGGEMERKEIEDKLNLPYDSHVVQAGAVQAHINALRSAIDTRFSQERTQMGEAYVQKDPDYIRLQNKLQALQDKADKLYKGDFSYARGGASNGDKPALPKGVTSIQVIQP